MPEIARFFGILIKMFLNERELPVFYAIYGEYIGKFDVANLTMLEGDLPPRAVSIVKEWAELYQKELLEMWKSQKIYKLPPLE